jgi:ribosomal protein L7Ae-like RNA K-turn-binding protein
LAFLGLCRRAGFLTAGFKAVVDDINTGKSKAAIACSDISEKTFKELCFFAGKRNISVFRLDINSVVLSAATGTKAGVFCINDEGFAQKLSHLISDV